MFLLCLALLFTAAAALPPSGAAGPEDCDCSELLPVLFHAMRFTSCGRTETTQRVVKERKEGRRKERKTERKEDNKKDRKKKLGWATKKMDAQKTKQINNVKMRQAADEVLVKLVEKQQAGGLWGRDTGTGSQPEATPPTATTTHHTLTGSSPGTKLRRCVCVCTYFYTVVFKM